MLWWLDYSPGKLDPNSISSRFCFPLNVMCFDVVSHCVLSVCHGFRFISVTFICPQCWDLYWVFHVIWLFSVAFLWVSLSVTCLCYYLCLLFLHEFICPFALSLDVLSNEHIVVSAHSLSATAETITPIFNCPLQPSVWALYPQICYLTLRG